MPDPTPGPAARARSSWRRARESREKWHPLKRRNRPLQVARSGSGGLYWIRTSDLVDVNDAL